MKYWLVKTEPDTWGWKDQLSKDFEPWNGVRNHQARNFMNDMSLGDQVFFYHSQKEKAIVGIVEVVKEAYPDPSDETGRFVCVDLKAVATFKHPIDLSWIKEQENLNSLLLIKQPRLSVMPIDAASWSFIYEYGMR